MPNETRHAQEPTALSVTETIVESPTSSGNAASASSGSNDLNTQNTDNPKGLPIYHRTPAPRERTLDPRVFPPAIPPEHSNRTLVLCFDGTGDQFDSDNSNIVQLVSLLKKDDRSKQMVYYQAGIGTYTSPKVATPIMSRIRKTLDVMFASNLHAHVMSGYEFLMQNYIAGDRISIFGFSRGAYTARSLAGMLHKVGLLPADNFQQVPFAYKMYTRTDDIGWEQSNEFKKAFSINVPIDFIGVWDTVDSVGIIPKRLPFTTSNTIVRTFRHAVSLDERRAKFKANLWNRPTPEEVKLGLSEHATPHPVTSTTFDDEKSIHYYIDKSTGQRKPKKGQNVRKESSQEQILNTFERMYSEKNDQTTNIDEVWFAGCHCDVGGGSVSNKTRHSLARIPLRWMIRECFKSNTGIMFLSDRLPEIGLDPSTLYPYVIPRPPLVLPDGDRTIRKHPAKEIPIRPHRLLTKKKHAPEMSKLIEFTSTPFLDSEEEEELMDALSPLYDQLRIKRAWWALEIIPLRLRYQRGDNQWVTYFGSNLAQPRFIPKQSTNGVKVHRSVKIRMEAEYEDERRRERGKQYIPKARLRVEPKWVD